MRSRERMPDAAAIHCLIGSGKMIEQAASLVTGHLTEIFGDRAQIPEVRKFITARRHSGRPFALARVRGAARGDFVCM
jgi:hypothetical protein